MLVRAIMEGYCGSERKLPGKIFNMDLKFMKKDGEGKPILPNWVEAADKASSKKSDKSEPQEPSNSKETQVI